MAPGIELNRLYTLYILLLAWKYYEAPNVCSGLLPKSIFDQLPKIAILVPRLPRPPPQQRSWTSWSSDLQSFFEAPEFDHVERKGDEDDGVSNGNDNCEDIVEMRQ